MPSKNPRAVQREIYRSRIKKLQRAGLLGPVDFRKKTTPGIVRKLEKYKSVISGRAAVVKAPDAATAQRLRKTLGLKGQGKTIVIPKEKGERYTFQKSTSEIVSKRPYYTTDEEGEQDERRFIKKTLSKGFPAQPEHGSGKRLYYTIPERTRGAGKLKRKTFGSFSEMLFYLQKYEVNFEDIEDHIEIEEVIIGGRKDKMRQKKIHSERAAAQARYKRRRKRPSQKKPRGKR